MRSTLVFRFTNQRNEPRPYPNRSQKHVAFGQRSGQDLHPLPMCRGYAAGNGAFQSCCVSGSGNKCYKCSLSVGRPPAYLNIIQQINPSHALIRGPNLRSTTNVHTREDDDASEYTSTRGSHESKDSVIAEQVIPASGNILKDNTSLGHSVTRQVIPIIPVLGFSERIHHSSTPVRSPGQAFLWKVECSFKAHAPTVPLMPKETGAVCATLVPMNILK